MSIRGTLFSAYAEVFPKDQLVMAWVLAFLCLRRGVSTDSVSTLAKWILFSAYAEVFPSLIFPALLHCPFLCLRRGVSGIVGLSTLEYMLFSAYAEVFPSARSGKDRV